jgi:hypothetical protein
LAGDSNSWKKVEESGSSIKSAEGGSDFDGGSALASKSYWRPLFNNFYLINSMHPPNGLSRFMSLSSSTVATFCLTGLDLFDFWS